MFYADASATQPPGRCPSDCADFRDTSGQTSLDIISGHHGAGKSVAVLDVLTLFFLKSARRPRYLANDLTEIEFDMGFLALYQISQA